MEEMAAILSNQDLAENDLMGAIKIIKADSDDTTEEVSTHAVLRERLCYRCTLQCGCRAMGIFRLEHRCCEMWFQATVCYARCSACISCHASLICVLAICRAG